MLRSRHPCVVQYLVGETMPEVRLKIDRHRAVLQLLRDDGTSVDTEEWVFDPPLARGEARGTARETFDDVYDYLNFVAHGLPEPESE
jgi:hypothetical protein